MGNRWTKMGKFSDKFKKIHNINYPVQNNYLSTIKTNTLEPNMYECEYHHCISFREKDFNSLIWKCVLYNVQQHVVQLSHMVFRKKIRDNNYFILYFFSTHTHRTRLQVSGWFLFR